MTDEANERSALLQNGHATAEPEVGFELFSTFMSPGLMAKLVGRIYRKRQRKSEELVTN